jgi:hypothetical protein
MFTKGDTFDVIGYVTPQAGSGGVFLRSAPQIADSTKVGGLNEKVRLELDQQGSEWHAARVYVASQVAEGDGKSIKPKTGFDLVNLRSVPDSSDPATDVGDLHANQSLEQLGLSGDWLVGRVYVSAQFTTIVQKDSPPSTTTTTTTSTGSTSTSIDLPNGSPLTAAELQQINLAPAQTRSAPAGSTPPALSAANIWNKYGGLLEPLANKIGIDPAAAVAVIAVESGGSGFRNGPDGKPRLVIRFENHLFWFNWGKANAAAYNTFLVFDQNTIYKGHQYRTSANSPWLNVHSNQDSEWAALGLARGLNDHAARLSISMGLVQILGSNFSQIGYPSAEAMFDAFSADERYQLLGFFNFVKADPRQVNALKQQDFVAFAKIYNGPGQPDYYGGLIKGVFDGFHTLTPDK